MHSKTGWMAANDLFRTTQEHPPVDSGAPYDADDLEQIGGEVSSRFEVQIQINARNFEKALDDIQSSFIPEREVQTNTRKLK